MKTAVASDDAIGKLRVDRKEMENRILAETIDVYTFYRNSLRKAVQHNANRKN